MSNPETIKIKSSDPANQGPFVIINRTDFNPDVHELYGDDQHLGDAVQRAPTMAELLAARDQLAQMRADLDAEAERVRQQAEANADEAQRLREQDAVNQAEAQRLRDEAAKSQTEQGAEAGSMTAAQLREALTARGIQFASNAAKAELQALLAA